MVGAKNAVFPTSGCMSELRGKIIENFNFAPGKLSNINI